MIDKSRIIRITLTDQQVEQCWKWQQEVMDALKDRDAGRNYTGLHVPNRFYRGYLGEYAVHLWLNYLDIPHVWRVSTTGRSQQSEIRAPNFGLIEVKTNYKVGGDTLMWPASQDQKNDFTVCVAVCRLGTDRNMGIMGWIWDTDRPAMKTQQLRVESKTIHYNRTRIPRDLLSYLRFRPPIPEARTPLPG